jgi:hypothetical protein
VRQASAQPTGRPMRSSSRRQTPRDELLNDAARKTRGSHAYCTPPGRSRCRRRIRCARTCKQEAPATAVTARRDRRRGLASTPSTIGRWSERRGASRVLRPRAGRGTISSRVGVGTNIFVDSGARDCVAESAVARRGQRLEGQKCRQRDIGGHLRRIPSSLPATTYDNLPQGLSIYS